MKREKKDVRRRLELKRESLRQIDRAELQQVAGGWWLPCMGTTGSYFCG